VAGTTAAVIERDRAALQRRTLGVLMTSQAPGNAAVASAIAVSGLLAADIVDSDRLAGVAFAALTLGAAGASVGLSRRMAHRGRRPGLRLGYTLGAVGAAVALVGGQARLLAVFLVGMLLFGCGQAANLQARYAAADLAEPEHRGRAISTVVWVGTLGAVLGPTIGAPEDAFGQAIGLRPYVGAFLFAVAFFVIAAATVAVRLRPDPLVVVGGLRPPDEPAPRLSTQLRRSAAAVAASPRAGLALAAIVGSQTAMIAVMTMTPLHMRDHGHATLSLYVIAFHIVGMYGCAPIVGRLADRWGRPRAIGVGGAILGAGTVVAVLAGYHPGLIFVGLFLLGLGWSFGLIGGSALLTESVPVVDRVPVQGSADLLMNVCSGTAAFASGFVKAGFGFHALANFATLVAGALVVAALLAHRSDRAGRSDRPDQPRRGRRAGLAVAE
jgi:MFS family permease